MELIDVVRKLIGPVNPIGESNTDEERFENLKTLTELVDFLVGDIDQVLTAYENPTKSKEIC